jgi:hypothetical protein
MHFWPFPSLQRRVQMTLQELMEKMLVQLTFVTRSTHAGALHDADGNVDFKYSPMW